MAQQNLSLSGRSRSFSEKFLAGQGVGSFFAQNVATNNGILV